MRRCDNMTDCKVDWTIICETPHERGIYFLYDESGKLIYIGKAKKSIRMRLNMHYEAFCKFDTDLKPYLSKINELSSQNRNIICNSCSYLSPIDMNWDKVNSATFIKIADNEELKEREKELIKKHLPCYNFESNSKEYWDARKCYEPKESVLIDDLAKKMM